MFLGMPLALGSWWGLLAFVLTIPALIWRLLDEEEFGGVDDGVDALLEGLHRSEGLEGIAEQDDGGVAALAHRHVLNGLQGQVFADVVGGKEFLDDDDLIADLAETDKKIAVGGGGVDLVAQFGEAGLGGFEPFGGGKGQQGRLVGGADEIKFVGHG